MKLSPNEEAYPRITYAKQACAALQVRYRRWRNDVGTSRAPAARQYASQGMSAGDMFSVDEGDGFTPEVDFYIDRQ